MGELDIERDVKIGGFPLCDAAASALRPNRSCAWFGKRPLPGAGPQFLPVWPPGSLSSGFCVRSGLTMDKSGVQGCRGVRAWRMKSTVTAGGCPAGNRYRSGGEGVRQHHKGRGHDNRSSGIGSRFRNNHFGELPCAQADGPECSILFCPGGDAHGDTVDHIENCDQRNQDQETVDKQIEAVK